jgi:hypothetical protein
MNRNAAIILFAGLVVTAWFIHDRGRQAAPPASAESSAPVSTRLVRKPRLPAPRMTVTAAPAEPQADDSRPTNLLARLLKDGDALTLRREQVEPYLQASHRSAESLLAAFRVTNDPALLREALEQHPNDPQVNFAACFALKNEMSPGERRQRLEAFKQSAPDNALANYLSAQDHFQSGQSDQAVQELVAAVSNPRFRDYSSDFVQNIEEAYRAAGYSEGEAKAAAAYALPLPQLAELRRLGQSLGELAILYRQAGDEASAQAALQMGVALGRQVAEPSGSNYLIHDLVGLGIERQILERMDPGSPYDTVGRTVQDRLGELAQRREEIRELQGAVDPDGRWDSLAGVLQSLSEQDLISFFDRIKVSGELEALRWARTRLGGR